MPGYAAYDQVASFPVDDERDLVARVVGEAVLDAPGECLRERGGRWDHRQRIRFLDDDCRVCLHGVAVDELTDDVPAERNGNRVLSVLAAVERERISRHARAVDG